VSIRHFINDNTQNGFSNPATQQWAMSTNAEGEGVAEQLRGTNDPTSSAVVCALV